MFACALSDTPDCHCFALGFVRLSEMPVHSYLVLTSETARRCTKDGGCGCEIAAGTVHIVKQKPKDRGFISFYRHLECVTSQYASSILASCEDGNVEDLTGFHKLGKKDSKLVRKAFAGAKPRKSKPEKDPDAPKHPPSAYSLWCKEEWASGTWKGVEGARAKMGAEWKSLTVRVQPS